MELLKNSLDTSYKTKHVGIVFVRRRDNGLLVTPRAPDQLEAGITLKYAKSIKFLRCSTKERIKFQKKFHKTNWVELQSATRLRTAEETGSQSVRRTDILLWLRKYNLVKLHYTCIPFSGAFQGGSTRHKFLTFILTALQDLRQRFQGHLLHPLETRFGSQGSNGDVERRPPARRLRHVLLCHGQGQN